MAKKLFMGNEAIARGTVEAGLNPAVAYPETPSSEIVGTLAERSRNLGFYAEWSVNEKALLDMVPERVKESTNALLKWGAGLGTALPFNL